MDRINLLKSRRNALLNAGKEVRDCIAKLIDEKSFVELSSFSFSKSDFFEEDIEGEGVVTGFATIDGQPIYLVAQNFAICGGGVSKANCDKIVKCINNAEKNCTPLVYILNTQGVQVGQGVTVLEGLANLIYTANKVKGICPQFCIINGDVFGQVAILSSICDFTFTIDKKSSLCVNSPLVMSAKSNKNLSKDQVGGVKGLSNANLISFNVKSFDEIKGKILSILNLLDDRIIDEDNLNNPIPALNKNVNAKDILEKVFDDKSAVEVGISSPEVKTVLGRIGGIACAGVIFDGKEAVELDSVNMSKLNKFADFVAYYELPYIVFTNTAGIKTDLDTNNSNVLNDISSYLANFDAIENAKISIVTNKAIGLGYTLFASKSIGFDYAIALSNSEISLFDSQKGAMIELGSTKADADKLAQKYADENSDPINTAKDGYIDDIIEPQFIRQYIIASLQMLMR